jgi:hypothetical protein
MPWKLTNAPALTPTPQAGLQAWRIEALKPVPNAAACSGKLCVGDSYIILNSIPTKSGGFEYALHFWLGAESSQDEKGCAVRGGRRRGAGASRIGGKTAYPRRRFVASALRRAGSCARSAAPGAGRRAASDAVEASHRAQRAACAQPARWAWIWRSARPPRRSRSPTPKRRADLAAARRPRGPAQALMTIELDHFLGDRPVQARRPHARTPSRGSAWHGIAQKMLCHPRFRPARAI